MSDSRSKPSRNHRVTRSGRVYASESTPNLIQPYSRVIPPSGSSLKESDTRTEPSLSHGPPTNTSLRGYSDTYPNYLGRLMVAKILSATQPKKQIPSPTELPSTFALVPATYPTDSRARLLFPQSSSEPNSSSASCNLDRLRLKRRYDETEENFPDPSIGSSHITRKICNGNNRRVNATPKGNSLETPLTAPRAIMPAKPSNSHLPDRIKTQKSSNLSGSSSRISLKQICEKKRKTSGGCSTVTRHPQYWLPDGNTILQLENMEFNLHRSKLVKISPLFSSVLDGNQSQMSNIRVIEQDGDLRYHLDDTGVSLKDFVEMLDTIENALQYCHSKPLFATISSVLRAASSLDMPNLIQWSSRCFQDAWGSSVKQENESDSETFTMVSPNRHPNAVESVALARLCQDMTTLKLALYDLSRMDSLPPTILGNDREMISSVHEKLKSSWTRIAAGPAFFSCLSKKHSIPGKTSTPCTTDVPALALVKYAEAVHNTGVFQKFSSDPICGLQALIDMNDVWTSQGYCQICTKARQEKWYSNKREIWKDLDTWFGLRSHA